MYGVFKESIIYNINLTDKTTAFRYKTFTGIDNSITMSSYFKEFTSFLSIAQSAHLSNLII